MHFEVIVLHFGMIIEQIEQYLEHSEVLCGFCLREGF